MGDRKEEEEEEEEDKGHRNANNDVQRVGGSRPHRRYVGMHSPLC